VTEATAQSLTSLAARLTKPEDRETYAGLISYFRSLPINDEMFEFVELLGLLTLLGQRLPEALAESIAELRTLAKASGEYHAQVDERLAALPGEIAAGVDVNAMAESMSEAFRQQFGATGLRDTAALLRASVSDITGLGNQMAAALRPATMDYQTVAATITHEVHQLTTASTHLRDHNAKLIARDKSTQRRWYLMMSSILLLFGILCGIVIEKFQTSDALANISNQIERLPVSIDNVVAAPKPNHRHTLPVTNP
jgi:hypothetical protein